MALICVLSSGPYTSKHIVIQRKIPSKSKAMAKHIWGKFGPYVLSHAIPWPNVTAISHIWPKRSCYLGRRVDLFTNKGSRSEGKLAEVLWCSPSAFRCVVDRAVLRAGLDRSHACLWNKRRGRTLVLSILEIGFSPFPSLTRLIWPRANEPQVWPIHP